MRHAHVGHGGKARQLFEVRDWQDTRHDFHINALSGTAIAETQVAFDVEEELGDGAVSARVDFAFQVNQVSLRAFGFRMNFRIRRHGDIEVAHAFQQLHQIRGV